MGEKQKTEESETSPKTVYVVIERHHVSPERVVGTALTLSGAMKLVLDDGELKMWVPDESESGTSKQIDVTSKDIRAVNAFQWWDDGMVIWNHSNFEPGHIGSNALEARFQEEGTGYYVHWSHFTEE